MKIRFKHRWLFGVLFCLVGGVSVFAQTSPKIEKLRQEVRRLEKELEAKKNKENSVAEQIDDLEQEIGLRSRLFSQLKGEVKLKETEIKEAEKRLDQALKSYDNLKEVIRKRVVSMYKRGEYSDWEVLVTLSSWNQALVWMRYQQRIIQNDHRNLRQLKEKEAEIRQERDQIQNDLKAKALMASEAETQRGKAESRKEDHQKLLAGIQQDKKALQQRLQKNRLALNDAIKEKIREDQKEKKETKAPAITTNFAKLKGKLEWPVNGRVVSGYGRQTDPVLKIQTENLGVDIRASEGESVRAVCEGEVKWVTWQRGIGNLVLLDHGSGYYTVYGNLETVFVEAGEKVMTRDILGQVGDKYALSGPSCHFQVWKDDQHYDPLTWLGKK